MPVKAYIKSYELIKGTPNERAYNVLMHGQALCDPLYGPSIPPISAWVAIFQKRKNNPPVQINYPANVIYVKGCSQFTERIQFKIHHRLISSSSRTIALAGIHVERTMSTLHLMWAGITLTWEQFYFHYKLAYISVAY